MMLHVVGRVTESLASFLHPSLAHLDDRGLVQHVLWLDDGRLPAVMRVLPPGVGVTAVRVGRHETGGWADLRRALQGLLRQPGVRYVHFHGLRPWLVGLSIGGAAQTHRPACFVSPHGSRLLPLLPWFMRLERHLPWCRRRPATTIISTSEVETRRLGAVGLDVVGGVGVVDEAFWQAPRREAAHPCVIGGAYPPSREGARRLAWLAVILSDLAPGIEFRWLGRTAPALGDQLHAASVHCPAWGQTREVLRAMDGAWVFVASQADPRWPLMLAQAMAAGLPCVAVRTPQHMALTENGRAGLLVDDDAGLLEAVGALLDNPALRQRLGQTARESAAARYRIHYLRSELRRGYDALLQEVGDPGRPAPVTPVTEPLR